MNLSGGNGLNFASFIFIEAVIDLLLPGLINSFLVRPGDACIKEVSQVDTLQGLGLLL